MDLEEFWATVRPVAMCGSLEARNASKAAYFSTFMVEESGRFFRVRGSAATRTLWLGGEHWHDGCVYRGGIVTQFNVKRAAFRRRDGESGVHETVGNCDRISEVGVGADGVDQEEFVAGQDALRIGC